MVLKEEKLGFIVFVGFTGKLTPLQYSPSFISVSQIKKKKVLTKSNVGEKGFIWLTVPGYSPSRRGSRGKNASSLSHHLIKSRENRNASSLSSLLSPRILLSYTIPDPSPYLRIGAAHSGLGLPIAVNNKVDLS